MASVGCWLRRSEACSQSSFPLPHPLPRLVPVGPPHLPLFKPTPKPSFVFKYIVPAIPPTTASFLRLGVFSSWVRGGRNGGGVGPEAGGALSLSLCLTPWSELIHPSEPCQALTAGVTRRPTWRGGCWAAPGQRWCPESLGQLLGAGLVLLIVTPSAPNARPGHGRCLLNAHQGLGMGGWADGSQACSFVAISCVPWRREGGVGRARI